MDKTDPFYDDLLMPTIFLGCLAILGLPGNTLVLIVFSSKENQSVYRTVILTRAIYDSLLCGITIPFEIYDLNNQHTFQGPEWVCKLVRTINYILVFNSGITVLLMTVDRFRRVCRPFNAQMTMRIARLSILFNFLLCFVLSLPNIWIRGIHVVHLGINNTGYDCTISDDYINSKVPMIYYSILLILCILLIVVLIILYISIGYKIIVHFRYRKKLFSGNQNHNTRVSTIPLENANTEKKDFQVSENPNCRRQQYNSEERNTSFTRENSQKLSVSNDKKRKYSGNKMDGKGYKATKIAIVISVMYILSYIPTLTENILEAVYDKDMLLSYVSSSVLRLLRRTFVIIHVINPIIYGFIDEKFRENCKIIIMDGCKRCLVKKQNRT